MKTFLYSLVVIAFLGVIGLTFKYHNIANLTLVESGKVGTSDTIENFIEEKSNDSSTSSLGKIATNDFVKSNDSEYINDFIIVPSERIGSLVRAEINIEEIILNLKVVFGGENVVSKDFYLGEGFYEPGFAIYPNTTNEIEGHIYEIQGLSKFILTFRLPGKNDLSPVFYQNPDGVYKGNWRLANGLKIGSTLAEVEKANGAAFSLQGFGWDYGGGLSSWGEGKLPKELFPIFAPTLSPENSILGEQIIKSDNSAVQRSKPVIEQLYIRWEIE